MLKSQKGGEPFVRDYQTVANDGTTTNYNRKQLTNQCFWISIVDYLKYIYMNPENPGKLVVIDPEKGVTTIRIEVITPDNFKRAIKKMLNYIIDNWDSVQNDPNVRFIQKSSKLGDEKKDYVNALKMINNDSDMMDLNGSDIVHFIEEIQDSDQRIEGQLGVKQPLILFLQGFLDRTIHYYYASPAGIDLEQVAPYIGDENILIVNNGIHFELLTKVGELYVYNQQIVVNLERLRKLRTRLGDNPHVNDTKTVPLDGQSIPINIGRDSTQFQKKNNLITKIIANLKKETKENLLKLLGDILSTKKNDYLEGLFATTSQSGFSLSP
jgi:hypothetical protein